MNDLTAFIILYALVSITLFFMVCLIDRWTR